MATDRVSLEDLKKYPTMTRWFHPILLLKLLLRVVVSDLFGQYADRRLIVAALDAQPEGTRPKTKLTPHLIEKPIVVRV